MRHREQKKAKELRHKGWSVRAIAKQLQCPKSSVSKWVRGISLTSEQIEALKSNQDKARAKAANHPNSPKCVWAKIRNEISDSACKEISLKYPLSVLKVIGAALYWAEGYKISVNMVNFSNSDPHMIKLMMRFFREVCGVREQKFRGIVHIHPHLDENKAAKFWSGISGIPIKQFHKTQYGISRASKHKRDTLPLGTFRIVICDTRLQSKIKGWIKGIERMVDCGALSSAG